MVNGGKDNLHKNCFYKEEVLKHKNLTVSRESNKKFVFSRKLFQ